MSVSSKTRIFPARSYDRVRRRMTSWITEIKPDWFLIQGATTGRITLERRGRVYTSWQPPINGFSTVVTYRHPKETNT